MLPKKTITKRQKKEKSRKKLGLILIFIGLIQISVLLFYIAYLEKKTAPLSPLSKNQTSFNLLIEKKLKEKRIEIISLETEKDLNYKIILKNGEEIIFDRNKNIDGQLSSLQLILNQLKIEGKALKRLDFRYQKPIISF